MNQLSERLKKAKPTPQRRRIADYLSKDQEQISNMPPMDMVEEIGISDAPIIRSAGAIKHLGFTDPKNDICNSLIGETSASVRNMQLSERFDMLAGKYQEGNMPDASVEMMNYNTTRTFQQNSLEGYEKLAGMITKSRREYVAGLRGCIGASTHFSRLLGFAINEITHLPGNSETEVSEALQDVGPGDISILFSFACYYKIDMSLIDMAKEHKGRVCVVTDSLIAPMIKYADISLVVETSYISLFNPAIGADMVTEYMTTPVCGKNKEEYRLRARGRDTITEGFRLMQ